VICFLFVAIIQRRISVHSLLRGLYMYHWIDGEFERRFTTDTVAALKWCPFINKSQGEVRYSAACQYHARQVASTPLRAMHTTQVVRAKSVSSKSEFKKHDALAQVSIST